MLLAVLLNAGFMDGDGGRLRRQPPQHVSASSVTRPPQLTIDSSVIKPEQM